MQNDLLGVALAAPVQPSGDFYPYGHPLEQFWPLSEANARPCSGPDHLLHEALRPHGEIGWVAVPKPVSDKVGTLFIKYGTDVFFMTGTNPG